ncbi:MAG: histidine phosphatase family protein [Duncaniella sp.]|nr:histidine phosphatase family protein [Duncaniella sp.]MDE7145860.1 histidine phosphatase family protein [Duncaniella sp.]
MTKKGIIFLLTLVMGLSASAIDYSTTIYPPIECEGSSMPYPTPPNESLAYPDSLTPVLINHVGRHGARYMSSAKFTTSLLRHLHRADSLGCITALGKDFQNLCFKVVEKTDGRWGELDSIGMKEQQMIATRAYDNFSQLFRNGKIYAISSYIPRCIASMNEFTHQLSRLDNKIEIYTSSGEQNSPLLRPWESDEAYKNFISSGTWKKVYDKYVDTFAFDYIAFKLLGVDYPISSKDAKDFTLNMYKLIAGCGAIDIEAHWNKYLTINEYNALWSVENMHHYLTHSASAISDIPAKLATKLLLDLVNTTREAVNGNQPYSVRLRFGHAETLMPLLALMHFPECYYISDNFNTIGQHWKDFYVVPMAANLQMILFKSETGKYYVRFDLNEIPIALMPGKDMIYIPWETAEKHLLQCAAD